MTKPDRVSYNLTKRQLAYAWTHDMNWIETAIYIFDIWYDDCETDTIVFDFTEQAPQFANVKLEAMITHGNWKVKTATWGNSLGICKVGDWVNRIAFFEALSKTRVTFRFYRSNTTKGDTLEYNVTYRVMQVEPLFSTHITKTSSKMTIKRRGKHPSFSPVARSIFAKWLKEKLSERDLHESDLARTMGVSKQYINQISHAKNAFSPDTVVKICNALECDVKSLPELIGKETVCYIGEGKQNHGQYQVCRL